MRALTAFCFLAPVALVATAQAEERHAPCLEGASFEFILSANQFEMPAYDAKRRILAVTLPDHVSIADDQHVIHRTGDGSRILLPVDPGALAIGLADRFEGFQLKVRGSTGKRDPKSEEEAICGHFRIDGLELMRSGMVVAKGEYPRRRDTTAQRLSNFKITVFTGEVSAEKASNVSRKIASQCLTRGEQSGAFVQGALSIEIGKSLMDDAEEPRVVVDGLMHAQLSTCLVKGLRESGEIWEALMPGTRVNLNYYFRRQTNTDAP